MAREPRSLDGKVVGITGAARGIGRATAQALVLEGARVSIGDLDAELAERTAKELGGGSVAFDLNVTDRVSFTRFVDRTEEALGPIDILVNNAGIMHVAPFLDEDDEWAIRQFDINVHGVLHGMKIVLPRMVRRGSGHVVNVASTAGKAGFPGIVSYCGTKHAVVGITEAARQELKGSGVDFTTVMPVLVNTELAAGLKATRGLKPVEPEDVAAAIVDGLKAARVDVFVPKSVGPLNRFLNLLPRAAAESFGRAIGSDRLLADADLGRRSGYEERAEHSEPAAPPPVAAPAPEPRRRTAKAGAPHKPKSAVAVESAAASVAAAAKPKAAPEPDGTPRVARAEQHDAAKSANGAEEDKAPTTEPPADAERVETSK